MASRRGLALLVAAGVLGVLGLLATTFVTLARLERRAAQHRTWESQAELLARSGLEDALARIAAGQDPLLPGTAYGGENWDGSNNGLLSTYEAGQEAFRPTGSGTPADADACPPAHAMRPSFFVRAVPSPLPAVRTVDGRARGRTGFLAAGEYSSRILAGGFDVNDAGNPGLRGMLANLAEALDRQDGVDDAVPVDAQSGADLVDLRPPGGWTSHAQIRDLVLGGSEARLDALRPYLRLGGWRDPDVVAPNALGTYVGSSPVSWDAYRRQGHPGGPPVTAEPRAPVELGWARTRRPALIALLGGLRAMYLNECEAQVGAVGRVDGVEILLDWSLATDECRMAADAILAHTGPLDTWEQWNAFCDTLPFASAQDESLQAKRDLLKAAFNPNADLNKTNPDASIWRSVDKSDLLVHTTELSLFPVHGVRLSAVGRVLDAGGRILARREAGAQAAGPGILRFTTQAQFAAGRVPGGSAAFVSVSRSDDLARTWGHRLPGLEGFGAGLQLHPEPCVDLGTGPALDGAEWDGSLRLATIETTDADLWGVDPALGGLRILANYDLDFDLDFPAGNPNLPDAEQVSGIEFARSVLDPVRTNTLYPDGTYTEPGKACGYLDAHLWNGFHAVVSFWMKNNYGRIGPVTGGSGNRRGHGFFKWGNRALAGGGVGHLSMKQFFRIAEQSGAPGPVPQTWAAGEPNSRQRALLVQFELGHNSSDAQNELSYRAPLAGFQRARWELLTVYFDLYGATPDEAGVLIRNDGIPGTGGASAGNGYPGIPTLDPNLSSSLTWENSPIQHELLLGGRGFNDYAFPGLGGGADTTIDELAVYDFGGGTYVGGVHTGASPETRAAPAVLALTRYRTGRYYKGAVYVAPSPTPLVVRNEAGSWTSAALAIPAGSVLQSVDWTWIRPAALPDDYAAVDLLDAAGTQHLFATGASASPRDSGWAEPPASWRPGRVVTEPFRLRASFLRKAASPTVDDAIPILDSPTLDDLTLRYDPPGGRRILSWGP